MSPKDAFINIPKSYNDYKISPTSKEIIESLVRTNYEINKSIKQEKLLGVSTSQKLRRPRSTVISAYVKYFSETFYLKIIKRSNIRKSYLLDNIKIFVEYFSQLISKSNKFLPRPIGYVYSFENLEKLYFCENCYISVKWMMEDIQSSISS